MHITVQARHLCARIAMTCIFTIVLIYGLVVHASSQTTAQQDSNSSQGVDAEQNRNAPLGNLTPAYQGYPPVQVPSDPGGGVANAVFVTGFENTAGCAMTPCGDIHFPECGTIASPACQAGCPPYTVGALAPSPMAGQNGWHAWTPASCPPAPGAAQDQVSSVAAVVTSSHPNLGAQHVRFQKDAALPPAPPSAGAISKLLAPSGVAQSGMEVDVWINEPGSCVIGGNPCGMDGAPGDDCPGVGNKCLGNGVIGSQYNFRPRDTAGTDTVAANVVFAPSDTTVGSTFLTTAGTTTVGVGVKESAANGSDPDVCVLVPTNPGVCNPGTLEFRCIANYKTNQWARLSVTADPIARTVTHTFYPDTNNPGIFFTYVSCNLVSADNVDSIHIRHNNTQNAGEYMDVDNLAINIKLIPGACCNGGSCTQQTSDVCQFPANFLGAGTTCSGNPCAMGRCCAANGACSYTTSAGCAGTYRGGFPSDTCTINCCEQPVSGEDDPCDLISFPVVDPPRCVGGSNPGTACGPAPGQPMCTGGGVCAPNSGRTFSGNTMAHANVRDCPALDMAGDPDSDTRYYWEVFEISEPCVDLTINYCCSGEASGQLRSPVANFLVKQAGASCACDDAEDFVSFSEINETFGGTLPDFCPEGNFDALVRALGPGRYYLPIFIEDVSDGSMVVDHDYQLHVSATTCFTGGCCTGSACSTTNEVACRNGGGLYLGHGQSCLIACSNGACCQSGGVCTNASASSCNAQPTNANTYFGGTTCTQTRCVGGATPGSICTVDADCSAGATCEGITPCPPGNDKCALAAGLPTALNVDFTNVGARTDGPDDLCSTSPNLKDVWYNHTAACNGEVTISTCNPNAPFTQYDAVTFVYTDTTCPIDDTTRVSCDDDGCASGGSWSTTTFGATMGQPFKVRVGAFTDIGASSEGAGELDVTCGSSFCGNGAVGFGEQCDDGNTVSDDGCGSTCQIEGFACTTTADCRTDPDNNACNHAACAANTCAYTCIRHGDVKAPQNGLVDLDDILCSLAAFASYASCPDADIAPCSGNGFISLDDILAVLGAFTGASTCTCDSFGTAPTCKLSDVEPPQGNEPGAPCACSNCGQGDRFGEMEPGYLFSGEFHLSVTDLHIRGRGMDCVWVRTNKSKNGTNSAQGNNWDYSYNIRVQGSETNLILHNGNNRRDTYELQPDGTWTRREFFRTIEQNPDNSYTLTFPDSGTWNFHALDGSLRAGKILSSVDRNGNQLTFDYDGLGRLVKIHDTLDTVTHNRDITITYNANGFIASVTDFVGRSVIYEYYGDFEPGGSFGDLKSVTTPIVVNTTDFPIPPGHEFPLGKKTIYTYTKGFADDRLNHNLLTIVDPKGQTCLQNEYHTSSQPCDLNFDRLRTQTKGASGELSYYVYVPQAPSVANQFAGIKTIVNDRARNVKEYTFDRLNRPIVVREYTGRTVTSAPTTETTNRPINRLRADDPLFFETRYEYNSDSMRTRVIHPNGNEEVITFDSANPIRRSQGNMLAHCRLPGSLGGNQPQICEFFEYDDGMGGCCGTNFISQHTDGRGNVTLHSYDGNGNRVHTQHRIASIVEDWEYNAFGQLTAHVLPDNGSGHRQRDVFTYYGSGPQRGYLFQEIDDATGFALTRTYQYNRVGHRIREFDPRGHDTQYVYNQLNQIVRERSREVTTGSGLRYDRDIYYDACDNIARIDQLNLNDQGMSQSNTHLSTLFDYDCLNHPIRSCQEVGNAALNLDERSCANVQQNQFLINDYTYDANRNLDLIRHGQAVNGAQPSNTVRTLYDERDLIFREIQAEGTSLQSTTQYDYDGNRNRKAEHEGREGVARVTRRSYDGYNRIVTSTDAMSNITTEHYDANGNRTSTRTDGELHDITGSMSNIRLSETAFIYDAMDRLTRTDVAFFNPQTQAAIGDGVASTITEYTDNSKVRRITDDNNHSTVTTYDTANRESVVTDAKGNTRANSYDANSNVTTMTETDRSDLGNPNQVFVTTYAYDNLDRLIQTGDNAGNMHTYTHDSRNNRARMIDALGREIRYEYDGIDKLAVTTHDMDGDGADGNGPDIVTYQYWDDSLRLIGQADGNGNTTEYVYDDLDRLIITRMGDGTIHQIGTGAVWPLEAFAPDLSAFVSGYDVHDNRITVTDANGNRVTAAYDLLNRVISRSIVRGPGVSGNTSESYQYDGLSRIVQATDDDSIVARTHDSMNNVTTESLVVEPGPNQTTGAFTVAHDGVGNTLSHSYPGGRSLSITYDALDGKSAISDAGGSIANYFYVGPDRVECRAYPTTRTDYVYDGISGVPNPAGDFGVKNVIRTTHSLTAGGTILDDRTYLWDRMDNKTQRKDIRTGGPRLTHVYTYDAAYRMIRAVVSNSGGMTLRDTNYALDTVGNRTSVTGPPNPGSYTMDSTFPEPADYYVNQYTTTPFDGRAYDANGNLSSAFSGLPNPITAFYDYRNQTVQLVIGPLAQHYAFYAYDALGRRIQKTTNAMGFPQIIRYFSFGKQELEEQDSAGATQATYVYGNYIDEVLTMRRGGQDYFYHGDDLHNIMAVSNSSGAVVERYEYQDYGDPQFMDGAGNAISQSAIGNALLFTGRRFDAESRLYYFRSRYLDPITGRFTIRDPIGIWGDILSLGNGYAYAGNNPWSAVDPEGHGWFKKLKKKVKNFVERVEKKVRKFAKQVGTAIRSVARLGSMIAGIVHTALDHMMGERHPPRWNYGNHCGFNRFSNLPPKDALDECCEAHDRCAYGWRWLHLKARNARECNKAFCKCLRDAHCFGDPKCRQYRNDAKNLFCLWP